ncbi:hypothetical protein J2Z33_000092 [Rubellimicrobium aerolatum]|nr:hypothetical protein [Rubellimicrobium aerolatum]
MDDDDSLIGFAWGLLSDALGTLALLALLLAALLFPGPF